MLYSLFPLLIFLWVVRVCWQNYYIFISLELDLRHLSTLFKPTNLRMNVLVTRPMCRKERRSYYAGLCTQKWYTHRGRVHPWCTSSHAKRCYMYLMFHLHLLSWPHYGSVMFWSVSVCLSVCEQENSNKLWAGFHEIWGIGMSWYREQLLKFWKVRDRVRLGLGLAHLLLPSKDTVAGACYISSYILRKA